MPLSLILFRGLVDVCVRELAADVLIWFSVQCSVYGEPPLVNSERLCNAVWVQLGCLCGPQHRQ